MRGVRVDEEAGQSHLSRMRMCGFLASGSSRGNLARGCVTRDDPQPADTLQERRGSLRLASIMHDVTLAVRPARVPTMKCPKCEHENAAEARFCEQCATPLGRTCSNCGSAVSPTARFCPQCGCSLRVIAEESRFASPTSYTPPHLAEKILAARATLEGERKQVTVLFADIKGSMELFAGRDAE